MGSTSKDLVPNSLRSPIVLVAVEEIRDDTLPCPSRAENVLRQKGDHLNAVQGGGIYVEKTSKMNMPVTSLMFVSRYN